MCVWVQHRERVQCTHFAELHHYCDTDYHFITSNVLILLQCNYVYILTQGCVLDGWGRFIAGKNRWGGNGRKQNVNEGMQEREWEKHQETYHREQQEVKKRDEIQRKERWWDGGWEGGLMCPSWGEAGQKWLSVELNWLHYRSGAPESISDITHPSQIGSYNSQRDGEEQPICRMGETMWLRCVSCCFACFYTWHWGRTTCEMIS